MRARRGGMALPEESSCRCTFGTETNSTRAQAIVAVGSEIHLRPESATGIPIAWLVEYNRAATVCTLILSAATIVTKRMDRRSGQHRLIGRREEDIRPTVHRCGKTALHRRVLGIARSQHRHSRE